MSTSNNPSTQPSSAGGGAACILYAEDEENDIFLLKLALAELRSPRALQCVPDGEQAIDYLAGTGTFSDRLLFPLPALVLLDIKMPKVSGLEVLKWIRQQPQFKSLPVVMLTSSLREEDTAMARQLGADDYLLKVSHLSRLVDIVKSLHDRWLSAPAPAH